MSQKLFQAFVGLLMIFIATPSQAGSVSGNYYEDNIYTSSTCNSCTFNFTPTPASGFVTLTNIACSVVLGSTSAVISAMALQVSGTARDVWLPIQAVSTQGVNNVEFNIPINVKFGPSRTPVLQVAVTQSTLVQARCMITGVTSDN